MKPQWLPLITVRIKCGRPVIAYSIDKGKALLCESEPHQDWMVNIGQIIILGNILGFSISGKLSMLASSRWCNGKMFTYQTEGPGFETTRIKFYTAFMP